MKKERLDEIKAALSKTTPGEWEYVKDRDNWWAGVYSNPAIDDDGSVISCGHICKPPQDLRGASNETITKVSNNLRFVARSKVYVQELLEEVERLNKCISQCK